MGHFMVGGKKKEWRSDEGLEEGISTSAELN